MTSFAQLALNLESKCTYTREDFFRGEANNSAFCALIEKWPNWTSFSQILVGPAGSGKTHLARIWQELSGAVFLNEAEELEKVQSDLPNRKLPIAFILDDFPFNFEEREMLHLYNLVQENQGALLILSQNFPQTWSIRLPDLRSRLLSLPVHTLQEPDDQLLEGIIRKHLSDFQLVVPEKLIYYIITRIERSFAAVQNLIRKLNVETLSQKRKVDLKLVRFCLDDCEKG
jgi:chromosomal replication initiation ATPase DnaA